MAEKKYIKSIGHNDIFKQGPVYILEAGNGEVARDRDLSKLEAIARGDNTASFYNSSAFQNGRATAEAEIGARIQNSWPPKSTQEAEALGYEKGSAGSQAKNPLKGELGAAWQKGYDKGNKEWAAKYFEEGKRAAGKGDARKSPYWEPAKSVWLKGYDSVK